MAGYLLKSRLALKVRPKMEFLEIKSVISSLTGGSSGKKIARRCGTLPHIHASYPSK
jgi:hypothetical protein